MIKQLRLKNYILIDELEANFHHGLNVITGETGSGKSIMLNALDVAFAPRVPKDIIKTNTEKAVIELVIDNSKHDLREIFEENGIDDCGSEILLTREVTPNAIRTRINGTPVNQEILKTLKSLFLDIHSQHQTYVFMQQKYQINLLDNYAANVYGKTLDEYKELYKEFTETKQKLENAKNSVNATENQIDFLKFQINEIEEAEIKNENEEEDLERELEVLSNAEKLRELTGQSYWAINGDDGSIIEALGNIKQNLSKAASLDGSLESFEQQFIDALENLRSLATELRDYSQSVENDEQRLNEVQERLFIFDKLKRKYGGSLESVLKTYDQLTEELRGIEFSEQNVEELEQKLSQLLAKLNSLADEISENRKNYAKVLSVYIQEKLEQLDLPKSRFEISVTGKELSSNGKDDVEFLISTNISEDLKPLAKVASGGEISRVMLAIKSIFADSDDIDTVIFDEIDTGISGKASQKVADEIQSLSKYHQIILITHQPIIASKADKHFYVRKSQQDETKVEVYVLQGDNRIKALAELAGGEINEQSMEFAKSLLEVGFKIL